MMRSDEFKRASAAIRAVKDRDELVLLKLLLDTLVGMQQKPVPDRENAH